MCAAAEGDSRQWPVIVASADSDFAGVLSSSVAWLQLLPPSRRCPVGCQLVTAGDFEAVHGFPASAHAAFLTLTGLHLTNDPMESGLPAFQLSLGLVPTPNTIGCSHLGSHVCFGWQLHVRFSEPFATGKPEAGVAGIGIGEKAAGKLVSRYRTISAVLEAAERGDLAGWGVSVRRAFSSSNMAGTAEHLRRNAAAVSICQDTSILEPTLAAAVQAAVSNSSGTARQVATNVVSSPDRTCGAASSGDHAEHERARQLAWMHPDAALRWRLVEPHARGLGAQLAAAGAPHAVQHALRNGCTIDVAVFDRTQIHDAPTTAVMLWTAADMLPSCNKPAVAANVKARLIARALQHRKRLASFCKAVVDVDCTGGSNLLNVIRTVLQQ